jgi:hypothetical protein
MTNTALNGATYDIDGGQQLCGEPDACETRPADHERDRYRE